MATHTKQAQGVSELWEALKSLPPRNAVAAGVVGLGGAGLLYQALRGKPPGAKSVMIPRQIRVALPRIEEEETPEESLSNEILAKQSQKNDEGMGAKFTRWLQSPGIVGGFALGAATPIGVYGLVRGYQQLSEELHAKKMREKALRLQALTDYSLPDEEVLKQSDYVVEKLANLEFEKRAGLPEWLGGKAREGAEGSQFMNLVYGIPFGLGALAGTGGLGAYLATRKQLLPEDVVDDRADTSLPQLLVDDEEGGYGLPGSPTYEV